MYNVLMCWEQSWLRNAYEKLLMLENIFFYPEEFEILLVDGKSLSGFM